MLKYGTCLNFQNCLYKKEQNIAVTYCYLVLLKYSFMAVPALLKVGVAAIA
jgi:hypothetical protein